MNSIYTVGGTVQAGGGLYLARPADEELLRLCRAGDFCYVLTPRQLGKSSLMIRAAESLAAEGVRTSVLDLTVIGTEVSADQWYMGLIDVLVSDLQLETDYAAWWQARAHLGLAQRLGQFLRQVVLEQIAGPVVIFVDEIDTTLSLDFTDDFFAAIRACFNARAADTAYARLSFVLLGVAVPDDLIRDPRRTPFNIGQRINLSDFTAAEAQPLAAGLGADEATNRRLLGRVLWWTDGHPYLTQKGCRLVAQAGARDDTAVDGLMQAAFLSPAGRDEPNVATVRKQVVDSPRAVDLLELYLRVLSRDVQVPDSERSITSNTLKLAGVVKADGQGWLRVRNRIYAAVFDRAWAQSTYSQLVGRGQIRFEQLLAEAQALFERKDYAACLRKLEILRELAPEFPRGDLEQRAREGQESLELAALYEQAVKAFDAGAWGAALDTLEAIHERRPDYPDPHDVAARARQAVELQNRLAKLYEDAVAAFQAEQWVQASRFFDDLLAKEPNYQDARIYLSQARRMVRLESLLGQARAACRAGDHTGCLDRLAELTTVDPDYASQEAATLRGEALAGLRAGADRVLAAGQIGAARHAAERLQQSGWDKDDLAVLHSAISARERAIESARRRRMQTVAMAGASMLALALIVFGFTFLGGNGGRWPTPPAELATVIVVVTSTQAPETAVTPEGTTVPPDLETATATSSPTPSPGTPLPSPTPRRFRATTTETVTVLWFPVLGSGELATLLDQQALMVLGRWPEAPETPLEDRWVYVQVGEMGAGFIPAAQVVLDGFTWDALPIVQVGLPTPVVREPGIVRLTYDPAREYAPWYSPRGDRITYQSNRDGNWEIYVMAADGSSVSRLTSNETDDYHPRWSPDGRRIAFASNRKGDFDIYVIDLADRDLADPSLPPATLQLIELPGDQTYPAFSSDGKMITFMSKAFASGADKAPQTDLYVADVETGQVYRQTNDAAADYCPVLSPDTGSIVFQSNRQRESNWDLYRLDLADRSLRRLTCGNSREAQPAVSPDGSWIVFESDYGGDYDLYVMDWDGGHVWRLTSGPAYDQVPSFAPDGSGVIFQSDRDGNADLYVVPFGSPPFEGEVPLACSPKEQPAGTAVPD